MQNILDDMQSDVANELEKVSLERLADINPDLLLNIKSAAQDSAGISSSRNAAKMMQSNGSAKNGDNNDDSPPLPIFLTETRSPAVVARSDAWYQFWQKQQSEPTSVEAQAAHVTAALQQLVTAGTADDAITHTQKDALQMTHYLATCLAVSQLLSVTQARVHRQSSSLRSTTAAGVRHSDLRGRPDSANQNPNGTTGHHRTLLAVVDPVDFTSEGIKRPNLATISLLYEMGLPFQSSADGRRFRTQLQLSHHLDFLFQKNQLEKTMAVTEERGWYVADPVWTREQMPSDLDRTKSNADTTKPVDEDDPNAKTFPADENRDCCVVCGIHFKMFFDNDDDGVYKYSNCLEIAVLNDDDVAERESEPQLVHATCWNGLGQPAVLTVDQTLQETVRHQQQRTS